MDEIIGWTEVDPVLGSGVGYGRTRNGGWYMSEYRGGDVVDVRGVHVISVAHRRGTRRRRGNGGLTRGQEV